MITKTGTASFYAGILLLSGFSHASVIFTDTFDSGTGAWYKGGSNGTLANDNGALSWDENGGDSQEVIGRTFASTTLEIGETLRLSYDFRQTDVTPSIIRVGLYNFQNAITADSWAVTIGGTVQGYYSYLRDDSNAGNGARRESISLNTTAGIGPTINTSNTIGTNTVQGDIANDGSKTYQVYFEVTRVSATETITSFRVMDGATNVVYVDGTSSVLYNTFNTVAIRSQGGTAIYDNIKLEVIPEPSAVFLSLTGLLGLTLRRTRRC